MQESLSVDPRLFISDLSTTLILHLLLLPWSHSPQLLLPLKTSAQRFQIVVSDNQTAEWSFLVWTVSSRTARSTASNTESAHQFSSPKSAEEPAQPRNRTRLIRSSTGQCTFSKTGSETTTFSRTTARISRSTARQGCL